MIASVTAQIGSRGPAVSIAPPNGWTLFAHQSNGLPATWAYCEVWWYWKVYQNSDPAAFSWNFNNTGPDFSGAITGWANVNTASPIDVAATAYTPYPPSEVYAGAPSVTPNFSGGTLVLTFAWSGDSGPVTSANPGLSALHRQIDDIDGQTLDDFYQPSPVGQGVATSAGYESHATMGGASVSGAFVIEASIPGTPTPNPVPSQAPTWTPSPDPTWTPSPDPTWTPIPTPGPIATIAPRLVPTIDPPPPSPSPTATWSPTPVPTASPAPSPAPTPAPTPRPARTLPPSPAPTLAPTSSPAPTPASTPSPTPTADPPSSGSGLDAYGGTTAIQCPDGPKPHFYTQKISNRWWLCDPPGNGFFLKGVYDVTWNDSSALTNAVSSKYVVGPNSNWEANWGLQSVRRLELWGFDTLSEYASEYTWPGMQANWKTSDGTIPDKMPFLFYENPSYYSLTNAGNYASAPVKDILNGVKSNIYTGYRSHIIDAFDSNFGIGLGGALQQDWATGVALGLHNDYFIGFDMDESDDTMGIRAGPDFETVDDAYTGTLQAGYGMPHTAWLVLVTDPMQVSNQNLGLSYSNGTVYSKQAMSTYFSNEYSGNIAALNAAWGSNYTTFGTTDHGGAGAIQNGTYAGFGTGSGLLDEDGTCPSRSAHQSCWVGADPYNLTGETPAMQADMSAFFSYWLDQYFGAQKTQYNLYAPGYLLTQEIGGWGAPPRREVLIEAAKYVDIFTLESAPPSICLNCTDAQARINFTAQYGGDKPWINWQGFIAQQDSSMSAYSAGPGTPAFTTQQARGAGYQNMVNAFLNAADANGTYHIVGFEWWGMYDMISQQTNWGLLTPNDNAYDGRSAIVAKGTDQWGYPTGGEAANYGDFVDSVQSANSSIYSRLIAGSAAPTPQPTP
jgi:hypothetical protein